MPLKLINIIVSWLDNIFLKLLNIIDISKNNIINNDKKTCCVVYLIWVQNALKALEHIFRTLRGG